MALLNFKRLLPYIFSLLDIFKASNQILQIESFIQLCQIALYVGVIIIRLCLNPFRLCIFEFEDQLRLFHLGGFDAYAKLLLASSTEIS